MATPTRGPQWWDREFDDLGNLIRTDVREAGHKIWPSCCARAQLTLGDDAEAPELMEAAVSSISKHLDRSGVPPPSPDAQRLLGLHFSQLLQRRAGKLRRIEFVGTTADLDVVARRPDPDRDWADRVNLKLDFDRMRPLLSERNYVIFLMRRVGHPWDEVSEKTGIPSKVARAAFWRAISKARSIIECKKDLKGSGGIDNR